MQRHFVVLALVFIWSNIGCDPSVGDDVDVANTELVGPLTHELVDNRYWVQVTGADDPWAGNREADVAECTDPELDVEELADDVWFDITTKVCGYATVHQTLLHDVPKGALLTLRIWHFKMSSWEGTFHLAYQIGFDQSPEWETKKEVPSESGLIYEQWEASRDFNAGDDIYFHLSNHGENTWSLIEFSATY